MLRARIIKLVAAATIGLAVAGATAAAPPGAARAAPSSIFRIDASPQPSGSDLRASTAIAANDVWAVGSTGFVNTTARTLAEHFDGSVWSVVPTPNPSSTDPSHFTAVNAVSSSDVWAIGVSGPKQFNVPFTEHWDGKTWSIIPLTDPTTTNNNVVFNGVKAFSSTNVYAVGAYQGLYDPMQFIEHWNGRAWKVIPNPFDAVIPAAIDGSSASDIWIVGQQRSGGITEYFNGTAWSVVPSASPYGPDAVAVLSPTDAWAVSTLDIQHWDGSTWKLVKAPTTVELYGITAVSATDIWAVGITATNAGVAAIEHWNGHSWSVVASPDPGGSGSWLNGVSSTAGGHVYAVGFRQVCDTCGSAGLIIETDGG